MKTRNWILLRGLYREQAHWGDFLEKFKHYFPNDQVVCLDIAGSGTEYNKTSFLNMTDFVEDLRKRNPFKNQKASLFSISMGSMMALEWAHLYPEEIESVVCINTSGFSHFYERLRPGIYPQILKIIFHTDEYVRSKIILEFTTRLRSDLDALAADNAKVFYQRPISLKNAVFQLLAASRYQLPQKAPSVPLLFLRSLGDELCHPACTENICKYWKLEYKTHPTAGHDLPLDDAEWCCDQIKSWGGQ